MSEQHPFREIAGETAEQKLERLRELCAQLWDQVWWLSLPDKERKEYERQGFSAPIKRFYEHD